MCHADNEKEEKMGGIKLANQESSEHSEKRKITRICEYLKRTSSKEYLNANS